MVKDAIDSALAELATKVTRASASAQKRAEKDAASADRMAHAKSLMHAGQKDLNATLNRINDDHARVLGDARRGMRLQIWAASAIAGEWNLGVMLKKLFLWAGIVFWHILYLVIGLGLIAALVSFVTWLVS